MAQRFLLNINSVAALDDGFIAQILATEVQKSVRNKTLGNSVTVSVVPNDDADLTPLVATTTTVVTDGTPATSAETVEFEATITGGVTTEGYVVFSSDQDGIIGVAVPVAGVATITTDALTEDSHVITAVFTGDDDFASSSDTVAQVITAP